jgi:hypothetical protein
VVWTAFLRNLVVILDPDRIQDPDSGASIGSGAFNLVRRSALERTEGFKWLRLETADDMALGMMLKSSGARQEGMDGAGSVRVDIYPSIRRLLAGLEKNGGTTAGTPWRFTLGIAAFLAVEYSPLVALALGPAWLRWIGLAAFVWASAVNVNALLTNTGRWAPALLWPLGPAFFAYGTLRATWLAVARHGVLWRGTFYPLAEIEAARRYELPPVPGLSGAKTPRPKPKD